LGASGSFHCQPSMPLPDSSTNSSVSPPNPRCERSQILSDRVNATEPSWRQGGAAILIFERQPSRTMYRSLGLTPTATISAACLGADQSAALPAEPASRSPTAVGRARNADRPCPLPAHRFAAALRSVERASRPLAHHCDARLAHRCARHRRLLTGNSRFSSEVSSRRSPLSLRLYDSRPAFIARWMVD
jgi:hypothetical protein